MYWYIMEPPHVGWWNVQSLIFGGANFKKSNKWSWWDGERWSYLCRETHTAEEAAARAECKMRRDHPMLWAYYWPKDTGVQRIDPRTLAP